MKAKKEEIALLEDKRTGKEDYSDVLDALKDAVKIYDSNDYSLTSNFVWAKQPDQKTQDFIIRMHAVAKKIQSSFINWRIIETDKDGKPMYNPEEGGYKYKEIRNPFRNKAYNLVMLPAEDWAILNRNNDENTILKGILQWNSTEKELSSTQQEEKKGMVEKVIPKAMTNYFKKKPKQEQVVFGGE